MRERLDPAVDGGPLLGLNGIVVKSHGGADAAGFANAIRIAADLAASDYRRRDRPQPERPDRGAADRAAAIERSRSPATSEKTARELDPA